MCREDFLADGFRQTGDALFEGTIVSYTYPMSTFQVMDVVVDSVQGELISPADRANRTEWKGTVAISWIDRHSLTAGGWAEWRNRLAGVPLIRQGGAWARTAELLNSGVQREEYHGCTRALQDFHPLEPHPSG